MKKVVYNACFGGFGLSADALYLLFVMGFPFESSPLGGFKEEEFPFSAPNGLRAHKEFAVLLKDGQIYQVDLNHYDRDKVALRSHPILVQVVEKLGKRANSRYADLKIEEIGNEDLYAIEEYDGRETVRVMSPDHYVAGHLMTPVALPEVPWAQPLLSSQG